MTFSSAEANASETTGLLSMPSPHSDDGPVMPKYDKIGLPLAASVEDVHQSLEIQMQQTLNDQSKGVQSGSIQLGNRKMKRGQAIALLVCTCFFSVAVVVLVYFNTFQGKEVAHSGSLPFSPKQSRSDPLPFSDKHPVRDLGLIGYSRPLATAPPEGLFRQMNNSTSETDQTSLPTNAFYQNMLLLKGEPSNLHRAYALPYVIDAVGPIQGVSLHPNYLVASTSVVQLTFNQVFGLTLGAAGDVSSSSKKKVSHRYTIGNTTELGVTLHWVSESVVRVATYIESFLTRFRF